MSTENTLNAGTESFGSRTGTDPGARPSSRLRIAGVIIGVLVGAFLVFDVVGKFARPQAVLDGMADLGFPAYQSYVMGAVLLAGLVLFVVPRTAVLGAIAISAYLGGAVTANMRIESPLFSTTLSAVYIGILLWIGLILRRPELLRTLGLRR